MIKHVGETKSSYAICTKTMVVSGLLQNGTPIFGGTYLEFYSEHQARNYLLDVAQKCINDGTYNIFENHQYEICHIDIKCNKIYDNSASFVIRTFNVIRNYSTEYEEKLATSCIVIAVREGFAKIGLDTVVKVQELLNDVKYKSIIEEHIPSYVQENIDKFIHVGTTTCSGTDKGAIMLTSPDDLLERIGFN